MASGSGATPTQSQNTGSSASAARSSVPDDPVSKVKVSIPLLREAVSVKSRNFNILGGISNF